MKRVIIIGGGTFNPVRNHLALSAMAFGSTAKSLHQKIGNSELVLTKMADSSSDIVTNEDMDRKIEELIKDPGVGTVIMSAAICDYTGQVGLVESGSHAERLRTSTGNLSMELTPAEKLISRIRVERPDIFLVGFKTVTNKSEDQQFSITLKMMKKSKCNLVLSNDTVNRRNMIITPEETMYGITHDREQVLTELVEMTLMRNNLTYNRTDFSESPSLSIMETTPVFRKVLRYVIRNGGFIENNGNGFTPGHFCQKLDTNTFLSSQRKADHNHVFSEGLTLVKVVGEKFKAFGNRKPSVGARSQFLLLGQNPEYDCIIHTHNPLKKSSSLYTVEQKPFQCGSLECGLNTANNIQDYNGVKAVFLEKHGVNILFKSSEDPQKIIDFINEHIELGIKIK